MNLGNVHGFKNKEYILIAMEKVLSTSPKGLIPMEIVSFTYTHDFSLICPIWDSNNPHFEQNTP